MWPFLDQVNFEEKAFGPHATHLIRESAPFCALYYTVQALGCLHRDGGEFEPGKGEAWMLFQNALSLVPDILIPQEKLANLQANSLNVAMITN